MWLPIKSIIVILVLSCTVSEILHVFLFSWPHPYSTLILGVFPLHQIAHVWLCVSIGHKLFRCEIVFEVFHTVWKTYLNVTDRQTERRTHRQTTCNLITALCVASRGKKITTNTLTTISLQFTITQSSAYIYRVRQIKVIPCRVLLISQQRIRIFLQENLWLFITHIYV